MWKVNLRSLSILSSSIFSSPPTLLYNEKECPTSLHSQTPNWGKHSYTREAYYSSTAGSQPYHTRTRTPCTLITQTNRCTSPASCFEMNSCISVQNYGTSHLATYPSEGSQSRSTRHLCTQLFKAANIFRLI